MQLGASFVQTAVAKTLLSVQLAQWFECLSNEYEDPGELNFSKGQRVHDSGINL